MLRTETKTPAFAAWWAEWIEKLAAPALVVGRDYLTCGHCRAVGELGQICPGCGRRL